MLVPTAIGWYILGARRGFTVSKPPEVVETAVHELTKVDELEAAAKSISGRRLASLPA
jgi:hypothetical protein